MITVSSMGLPMPLAETAEVVIGQAPEEATTRSSSQWTSPKNQLTRLASGRKVTLRKFSLFKDNYRHMTHTERLTYLQAIARESDLRDRSILQLNLDVDSTSIVTALYAAVTPQEGGRENE